MLATLQDIVQQSHSQVWSSDTEAGTQNRRNPAVTQFGQFMYKAFKITPRKSLNLDWIQ